MYAEVTKVKAIRDGWIRFSIDIYQDDGTLFFGMNAIRIRKDDKTNKRELLPPCSMGPRGTKYIIGFFNLDTIDNIAEAINKIFELAELEHMTDKEREELSERIVFYGRD